MHASHTYRGVQPLVCVRSRRCGAPQSLAPTLLLHKCGAQHPPLPPCPQGPLLIWDAANGFAPKRHTRWANYYEQRPRQPERVFELASYVARLGVAKSDARAAECVPDFSHETGSAATAGMQRPLMSDPAAR